MLNFLVSIIIFVSTDKKIIGFFLQGGDVCTNPDRQACHLEVIRALLSRSIGISGYVINRVLKSFNHKKLLDMGNSHNAMNIRVISGNAV